MNASRETAVKRKARWIPYSTLVGIQTQGLRRRRAARVRKRRASSFANNGARARAAATSRMALSRPRSAELVLHVLEHAARGNEIDPEDADDDECEHRNQAWQSFTSEARYVAAQSSAGWKAEFERTIANAHSMRVMKVSDKQKATTRGDDVCIACGRPEADCRYAIDMVGDFAPLNLCCQVDDVARVYSDFQREYAKPFEPKFLKPRRGVLSPHDHGRFIVGRTCLRKAKLRFQLQSTALDAAYSSEKAIDVMHGERSLETLYTVDEEVAEKLVEKMDRLKNCVRNDKAAVPALDTDSSLWERVDQMRHAAAGGDEDLVDRLTGARAAEIMSKNVGVPQERPVRPTREPDREPSRQSDRGKRKRRACVVDDDEEGGDTEPEVEAGEAGPSGPSQAGPSRAGHGAGLPAASAPREAVASARSLAAARRADGSLGSRRSVVSSLLDVALRLSREGRDDLAAAVTAGVSTMQEILQILEDQA